MRECVCVCVSACVCERVSVSNCCSEYSTKYRSKIVMQCEGGFKVIV